MTKEEWIKIYNEEYINKKMSLVKIGKEHNCSTSTVHRNFIKYDLKTRDHSEKVENMSVIITILMLLIQKKRLIF